MPSFSKPIRIARRRNDLLCVGELLVDMIAAEYGSIKDCSEFRSYSGGSSANIASNARSLGLISAVASAVGVDGLGDFLVGELESRGLDTTLIQRREEATSMVVLTRSQATPTPIFYRSADYHIDLSPELEAMLAESSILHFSCWPISRSPSRETVAALIRAARERGGLICFDPNYHPSVWPERSEAITFLEKTMPDIDIIKPSEDDAQRLFGMDSPEAQARRFLDLGAKVVIMTLGAKGAIATDGAEWREYPSLAGEVVDTTGAGDAFWSGLYAGLVEGRTLDASVRVGMAVSAIKLRRAGAAIPRTSLGEIEAEFGL